MVKTNEQAIKQQNKLAHQKQKYLTPSIKLASRFVIFGSKPPL